MAFVGEPSFSGKHPAHPSVKELKALLLADAAGGAAAAGTC